MDKQISESMSLACGNTPSSCRVALSNNYETTLRADPCVIMDETKLNEKSELYRFFQPGYKTKTCESSGYLNCSTNAERFGPQQVQQESYLQGRGQVTGAPGCAAAGIKYLPKNVFSQKTQRKSNQELFAQSTLIPRACGSLTEVDMGNRLTKMPTDWQGAFTPFLRAPAFSPGLPEKETVTLGTVNKYPDWGELRKNSEAYMY